MKIKDCTIKFNRMKEKDSGEKIPIIKFIIKAVKHQLNLQPELILSSSAAELMSS